MYHPPICRQCGAREFKRASFIGTTLLCLKCGAYNADTSVTMGPNKGSGRYSDLADTKNDTFGRIW
jgi:ribosomal protein L40E